MARPGKRRCRQIKLRPPTSSRHENGDLFPLIPPSCKVYKRYMLEKWEPWEPKHARTWFAIDPNPDIFLRKSWAMQLAEEWVLKQRSGLLDRDIQTSTTRQEFNETKTQCHNQYVSSWVRLCVEKLTIVIDERHVTNWFKNTRESIKWGRTPLAGDLFDVPFSPATPTCASQPGIATDNLLNLITPTLTTYSSASFSPVNYAGDENTPTPRMCRCPDYHATPVASLLAWPEVSIKSTLDNLAMVAVEALECRQHNPYPDYPESVIYGAYLLLNLKG